MATVDCIDWMMRLHRTAGSSVVACKTCDPGQQPHAKSREISTTPKFDTCKSTHSQIGVPFHLFCIRRNAPVQESRPAASAAPTPVARARLLYAPRPHARVAIAGRSIPPPLSGCAIRIRHGNSGVDPFFPCPVIVFNNHDLKYKIHSSFG